MPNTRHFTPVKRGETFLAGLFFGGAAIMLLFTFVLTPFRPPPDPGFKGDVHLLILTAMFLFFGTVAWRWRPYKSTLELTDGGMTMSSTGMTPLAKTDVRWTDILELRLNVVTNRGRNPKTLHVTSQTIGAQARKDHALSLNGFEASTPDVMNAILDAAEAGGRVVKGPRPAAAEEWVDGLTWKLSAK